jgi:signal transduction histidine kinase/CheY-like chemotaxis protein
MLMLRSIASSICLGLFAAGAAAMEGSKTPEGEQGTEGMPPLRVFAERETGCKTMAWSAVQDEAGIMHFGCDTVVSFDGERWRQEDMDPTYAIRGMDIGPNGRIWVGGVNQIGWFERGAEGRLAYHSLMPKLPASIADLGDVWRVYAEGDDRALFVARERVLRWDGRQFTSWSFPGMRLLWSIRTQKSVYVHYPPLGLFKIGPEGPKMVVPASVIGASDIRWMDDTADDWLLLTSEGFKTLHNGRCTATYPEASSYLRAKAPTFATRLTDGSLAVGTLQGGIVVVGRAGDIRSIFNTQNGLPEDQIYSLFVDRDGALWGMGPSRIIRLAILSGVAVYGPQVGYPSGGCDSVAEYYGTAFIASHSDLLRLLPDVHSGAGGFVTLGITNSRFYSLLSLPQGLAVGHFHGLGLWTPGTGLRPLTPFSDIVFRASPSEARPGAILAAEFDRVVSIDPRNGHSTVIADSLPDYGDSVVDEPSGRLWIGTTSRGLFVAGPGTTHATSAAPRFGPLPTLGPAFVSRAGNTIVVLTKGAAYFLDDRSDRFHPIAGVPGGRPSAISNSDRSGTVWAALEPQGDGHSPRLGRISVTSDGAVWSPQSVEGLSGIGSLLGLDITHSPEGERLWIAGSESIIRANSETLAPNPPLRQPLIRAWFKEDKGGVHEVSDGVLPYSIQGIHIEFSSLDYGMRESERFQTMLGGVEKEWSPAIDFAAREISGLREGTYEFKVRLVSDSGVVGAPSVLRFSIAPPWWRTLLAYAGYAVAGVLAILALLRLRVNSLKRRALDLEKTVHRRTEQLEKANAAKTEFVASMSHEIRNPMGGILGSALELSETTLEPKQRELVSTLQNCAAFLASLVEDVLDFAAIEAGAYTVSRSPFSPREVLDAVATMLRPRTGGAEMRASVDPALPDRILGDAARIQQVVVNFAANALKFGGAKIGLSARPEGDRVVFAVTDDGQGIPPEEQRNLFIRFSRLKPALNSAIPGTGLGLAVCRALAERMGGTVGVASAPGRGSTFFLRLPLEVASDEFREPHKVRMQGSRALVVEDIEYNARALRIMLGNIGYEVDIAGDGEKAIERIAAVDYHAVFLDCDLPKVDGFEVARRLRAGEPAGKRTLIVATTAHSTVEDQNECVAAGMDAFIAKPITPEKLRTVLSASNGSSPQAFPVIGADSATTEEPTYELTLLRHLADGTPAGLERELDAFVASLDEAMQGVATAHASGSRGAVASAAHRVISHARMVGASALGGAAADLQDFAAVYTETELKEEIALLGASVAALRRSLAQFRSKSAGSGSAQST